MKRLLFGMVPDMLSRGGRGSDIFATGSKGRSSRATSQIIDISTDSVDVAGGKEQRRNQALLTKQEILLENINKFLTAPKKSVVNSHTALLDLLETLKHVIQDKTDFETLQKPQFFDDTLSEPDSPDEPRAPMALPAGAAAGLDASVEFDLPNGVAGTQIGGATTRDSQRYDRQIQKWMQETIQSKPKDKANAKKRFSEVPNGTGKSSLAPGTAASVLGAQGVFTTDALGRSNVKATTVTHDMSDTSFTTHSSPYLRIMAMIMKIDLHRPGWLSKITSLSFDVLELESFFSGLRIDARGVVEKPRKAKKNNSDEAFSVRFVPLKNDDADNPNKDIGVIDKPPHDEETLIMDVTVMVTFIFEQFGFRNSIFCDDRDLCDQVNAVVYHLCSSYQPTKHVAYHNLWHGAEVFHFMALFFSGDEELRECYTPREIFCILIAALGHDVDHDGFTNAFHCETISERSMLYNDVSVQENHHASLTIRAVRNGGLYPSKLFPDISTFNEHRKLIMEAILSTDMQVGFQVLNDFKLILLTKAEYAKEEQTPHPSNSMSRDSGSNSIRHRSQKFSISRSSSDRRTSQNISAQRTGTATTDADNMGDSNESLVKKDETGESEEKDDRHPIFKVQKRASNIKHLLKEHKDAEKHKLLTVKMALKCGDFSHFMRDFQVHAKWSQRVYQEFFRQGDEERRLFLTVGALNDRTKVDLPKSQIGCISFLIMPMVEPLFKFFGTEPQCRRSGGSFIPSSHSQPNLPESNQPASEGNDQNGHRASVTWAPQEERVAGPVVHKFLHEMQNLLLSKIFSF